MKRFQSDRMKRFQSIIKFNINNNNSINNNKCSNNNNNNNNNNNHLSRSRRIEICIRFEKNKDLSRWDFPAQKFVSEKSVLGGIPTGTSEKVIGSKPGRNTLDIFELKVDLWGSFKKTYLPIFYCKTEIIRIKMINIFFALIAFN